MADEILTYEGIRNMQKAEMATPKLTKLPQNFFALARDYLATKAGMLENAMDKNEFRNMRMILQDMLERREHKILNLALYSVRTGIPPENLLPDEKKFFERIMAELKEFRAFMDAATEPQRVKPEPVKLVAVSEALPAFVGIDMNTYGPFKPGDIATLPFENADVLIKQGKAEEIRADRTRDNAAKTA